METIEIIGAGYIGLPLAAAFSERGNVIVVENDEKRFTQLQNNSFIYGEPDVDALLKKNKDRIIYLSNPVPCTRVIVAVQTPTKEDGSADVSFVLSAIESVLPHLSEETLLVLESTVPVGTGAMLKQLLEARGFRGHFAYCPETILPGNVMKEIQGNARVIGSDDEIAKQMAKEMYARITRSDIDLCSFEEAELVKLLQNSARDVELAFANQVARIAACEGIDPFSLIEKINKHPRVHVLNPSSGVGGHCIAVDPLFLILRYGEDVALSATARRMNDEKPLAVAEEAERLCSDKDSLICVFGLAYKPNIGDVRNSSGIAICKKLIADGYQVIGCEPNSSLDGIEGIRNVSIDFALKQATIYVIAQPHKAFGEYKDRLSGGVFVDPCGFLR